MLERLVILALIGALLLGAVIAARTWASRRLTRIASRSSWAALGEQPDGRPALVVFSAPGCAACRTAQDPAVAAVSSKFGGSLRVVKVDIAERPELARAFNVLTAPSSLVIATDGTIRSFNHGFAPADVLSAQLNGGA
jgi:thiol-disulfide isomerase/thioredoxin